MIGLKDATKEVLCQLYRWSGAMRLHEAVADDRFMVILLFHRVTDAVPEDGLTVSPARFRSMCRLLSRRFRVVSLAEVFRAFRTGEGVPRRTVAITFDDSYRDNLEAGRVLAEHDLPATFFLPTGYVGTQKPFPWDRGLPAQPHLTWADARALMRLGHEIGSHSVTHPHMGEVSAEQAREELTASKETIEQELGQPVRWFAYPFGGREHFRGEWLDLAEEAGYEGVVSAYGGFVRTGCNPRILPREAVPYFKSLANLELYLTGCLEWMYRLRGKRPIAPASWEQHHPAFWTTYASASH